MQVDSISHLGDAREREPSPQIAGLCSSFGVVIVFAVFWQTTWSMIEIWRLSDTYRHCFLVIPIVLWLIWSERVRLATTPYAPYWRGLWVVTALGAVWLLGVLAGAQVISQFAVVGLVAAVVLTVFGLSWTRVLRFPLLFLFFAVPFGEALVPWLMDWTAEVTIAALRLSGVPVYREGVHFVIPSGTWSVVEACSGIKFLIASLMAGTLYAWSIYRSTRRRLAFMAASVVVPLIANWLRAYVTVQIAHLTSNRFMTGSEHVTLGWILFGVAMFLLYWIGAHWREDMRTAATGKPTRATGIVSRLNGWAALPALSVLGIWPPLAHTLTLPIGDVGPIRIAAPDARAGWQPVYEPISEWVPKLTLPSATGTFIFQQGPRRVGVFVAAFRHQNQTAQLASSANQIVASTNESWKQTSRGVAQISGEAVAAPAQVRAATLRGPRQSDRLAIWQWYWIGGTATPSDLRGKLELARARLLRRSDTGLWVAVYTPLGDEGAAAQQRLRDFLREMGPSLQVAFSQTVAR